ncbi:hypothetical protein J5N97_004988 [Dioscorea zingiberensis]|uniref:Peptidase A1 domain-containing protein n=1 Tax=Dioscorea zingiberensis TaxID=325984 RepID=A0A9D5D908_9LILI|nr:hypothetical protein J5N97_004988 [Dioscorea zingiberensis]
MDKFLALSVLLLQYCFSSSLTIPAATNNILINHAISSSNYDHPRKHDLHRKIKTRRAKLTSFEGVTAEIENVEGTYLVNLVIGTPPVSFLASPTTVTDLIWTQCKPCKHCFNQSTPIYNRSKSSSFSKLPCSHELCMASYIHSCNSDCRYKQKYLGGSSEGVMGTETITFGSHSVPDVAFGCGNSNTFVVSHGSGVLGLGRGPQSLVSQLGIRRFSYCLPYYAESNGRLLLGSEVQHQQNSKTQIQYTPLVLNPSNSSFYYLTLHGITVGETKLQIPKGTFEVRKDGVSLLLMPPVFSAIDACFSFEPKSNVEVPKLIYHFDGADLVLPVENYVFTDSENGVMCLAILEGNEGVSTFGGIHQSNINMMFDLNKGELSFAPAHCKEL